jgi:hypothetical protein
MMLTQAQQARLTTIGFENDDTRVVAAVADSVVLLRPDGRLQCLNPHGRLHGLGLSQKIDVLEKKIDRYFPKKSKYRAFG